MSTFSTYNSIIEQKIANTSEVFFTAQMKRQAANDAIQSILDNYDPPELIKRATLSPSSGVASKPSDYYKMVKLWAVDDDGLQTNEYVYVVPDEFDRMADTAAYFWTEDYNVSAAAIRLLIKPTSVTSLQIRYVIAPTEMTDDSTDSGLGSNWDEAVAYGTVAKLLQNDGRYQEAQEFERLFKERVAQVYASEKNPGGIKQNNRLKSKYERISQLGNNTINGLNI